MILLKIFFLVSQGLSLRHKKQISKNVGDTTFKNCTNFQMGILSDWNIFLLNKQWHVQRVLDVGIPVWAPKLCAQIIENCLK